MESASEVMQDAACVTLLPDGVLRVAAVDGCTPSLETPEVAGVNGATYAANLIA